MRTRLGAVLALFAVVAFTETSAHSQTTGFDRIAARIKQNAAKTTETTQNSTPPTTAPVQDPSAAAAPTETGQPPDPAGGDALIPIDQTIGLPMTGNGRRRSGKVQINLGRESDEIGATVNLFDDPSTLRMLGDNPRFIYDSVGRPDPMVFPPVRNAAVYAELTIEADELKEAGEFEAAVAVYQRILDLKDRRFIVETNEKLNMLMSQISGDVQALIQAGRDPIVVVELPNWVRENTRGILYSKTNPMCLVGAQLLKPGQTIPGYPHVVVAEINKEKVIYKIQDQTFEVSVKGHDRDK